MSDNLLVFPVGYLLQSPLFTILPSKLWYRNGAGATFASVGFVLSNPTLMLIVGLNVELS
jgi:hypothetical protein